MARKMKRNKRISQSRNINEIRQIMKPCQICLTAVIILFLMTACGKSENSAEDNQWVWVPEFTGFEKEEDSYSDIAFLEDRLYYISYLQNESGFSYRLSGYSLTDGCLPDILLDWKDDKNRFVPNLFAMDGDGNFYLIAYVTEGDSSRRYLCKFDGSGTLVYDRDITGEVNSCDLIAVDLQGNVYLSGNISGELCLWLYEAEGKYRGTVSLEISNGGVSALECGKDGKIYVYCYNNSGDGINTFLTEIDFDNGKAGTSYSNFPKSDHSTLTAGGEQNFLVYDRTSVYAYDLTTQTGKTYFDWLDYDINGSYVEAINVLEDGRLLALIRDFSAGSHELALLTKVDRAQAIQKENIVLGTINSNSTLRNAVVQFNRGNQKYHVEIREYLDTQTHDWSDAALRMNNDILSGNCPDILDLADLNLKALASKGLFTDLNEYLENSILLKPSDFLDSLLDAYTIDDKLITIPSYFSMKTVMGWSSEVGEDMGWTLDDLMAYADTHPDAALFDDTSRSEITQYLMSYNEDAFIDWSSGKCYFDSAEFTRLLEFVARFPGEAEWNPEPSSTPVRIRNGEVLLYEADITEFDSIQLALEIYGGEGTCIGFPAADGSAGCMLVPYGAYAITMKSDKKDGAWAFIESYLTREDSNSSFFPTLKTKLEEKAAASVMANDKNAVMGIAYSDWEYTYHTPTQKEVDLVLALIEAAKPVSYGDGNEVIKIIKEEAESYYQGQKTVEEAAKVIQSRVQIYVNEN